MYHSQVVLSKTEMDSLSLIFRKSQTLGLNAMASPTSLTLESLKILKPKPPKTKSNYNLWMHSNRHIFKVPK